MSSSMVEVGRDRINTTVAKKESDINNILRSFMSNENNKKKIIGIDTEQVLYGTAWLQLCDGYNCLIVKLPSDEGVDLPLPLLNFLNLPHFTFVGFGIKKTMKKLESEYGLTCKNVVEVGPASWNVALMTDGDRYELSGLISSKRPSRAVFDNWNKPFLNQNQIELAVSNAHFAFSVGNIQLELFRVLSL